MLTLKLTLTDTDLGLTLGDTLNFNQDQNVSVLVEEALEELEGKMRIAQAALKPRLPDFDNWASCHPQGAVER